MWKEWFQVSPAEVGLILLSVVIVYAMILLLTRTFGLRSFSKMSTGDFAMTVAVGSLFAATIANPGPTIGMAAVAFLGLFGGQGLLAWGRRRSARFSDAVDNQPILLVIYGTILHDNLRDAQVTEADLYGKLREANAFNLDHVQAVVFEATGDVSVLHSASGETLDPRVLTGVDCSMAPAEAGS